MKRILLFIATLSLILTLAACGEPETIIEYVDREVEVEVIVEVEKELTVIPTEVLMSNVDDFLNRPDVQYVDLRNFDDKMKSGYISGFEMIPFFDYLEYTGVLVRTDGDWVFDAADIRDEAALRGLFNEDKAIFLMCASGTRAGYVKAALESLGYTDVYNIGGIGTYVAGDKLNYVFGDDTYNINMDIVGDYTPGTYYGYDTVGDYLTVVVIGPMGGIVNVMFDAVYGTSTKQNLGFDYGMTVRSTYEWFEHADMLAAYIVANQGWGDIILDEAPLDGLNALTVGGHFIEIDHTGEIDAVAGVSIGVEGFVLSWNDAISQASETNLGVVETVATAADWAAAHAPAFAYNDGVFYGFDEATDYFVKVTVVDGVIVEVFFDAIYNSATYELTTKQVLGEEYMLASGFTWAAEADMLSAAILDAQEWKEAWTVVDGDFDVTAQGVIDDVAGVTIHVDGFLAAWEEAMYYAVPRELFISEYIEGSSNNKAIEIYNPFMVDVDLTGYSLKEFNGTDWISYDLTGTLLAGEVLVVCNSGLTAATLLADNCDVLLDYPSVIIFNGNDVVQLLKDDVVIDQIGVVADAGGADFLKDVTIVRDDSTIIGSVEFDLTEWTSYPVDTYDYVGSF